MTLIELIVALMVVAIALLGLAGFSTVVSRQLNGGTRQTIAAMVVQSRFDSLASVAPCRSLLPGGVTRTGTATTRGVRESWVLQNGNNVIHVTDTVTIRGRTQPLVYRSIIVCRNS